MKLCRDFWKGKARIEYSSKLNACLWGSTTVNRTSTESYGCVLRYLKAHVLRVI
jgi:hypothetical protein